MTDDITIRPLALEDRAEWARMWTAYLAFYDTTLPQAVFDTAFARMLSRAPGEYQGLIAELDGRPVGLAHFLFHRILWSAEDTCYLMDLFAVPEARGRGVGRALIEAVNAAAKSADIPIVYWTTEENNQTARRLYDTLATRIPFVIYEKYD
ncbi:GNAT family N-acetyltransferase [Roseovarius spongiae]|uniref:GNAT family N-acetyltransferase n=1 Tax=Roseovarius spongiae TaxID=2320272 RepID=A0A3A8BAR9_9RHOB|nr:GNAT family N-acetyltransferase [Roseovarius spongiae]RKF16332.1 GNAT family N-acetyltransferase [Roseovarius spongiae]